MLLSAADPEVRWIRSLAGFRSMLNATPETRHAA
jgi:hypothetical protein